MGMECREAAGQVKVLDDIYSFLRVSQSQDVSQILSELTRPYVDHQSWHRPTFK